MSAFQLRILHPIPALARYATFELRPGVHLDNVLRALGELRIHAYQVVGIGLPVTLLLARPIARLGAFPHQGR